MVAIGNRDLESADALTDDTRFYFRETARRQFAIIEQRTGITVDIVRTPSCAEHYCRMLNCGAMRVDEHAPAVGNHVVMA